MSLQSQLISTIVGGVIAAGASMGTLAVQQMMRTRGDVTLNVRPWTISQSMIMAGNRDMAGPKDVSEEAGAGNIEYSATLRIHNQKDVSLGLMDLYISVYGGRQKLMELRPTAHVRYMGGQGSDHDQDPFEAATLPAQGIVVISLSGTITDSEKFRECTRVDLRARLSNVRIPIRRQLAQYD